MNTYKVTVLNKASGVHRQVEVKAHQMDFHAGILTFTIAGKGVVQAFRDWIRVDRMLG